MKKHGHYCKICGEYKANEKFSDKGHAAHICKSCVSLSVSERNEQMTLTRIMNLPWFLSKEQCAWLRNRCNDQRPTVREEAKAAYASRFPYAERNKQKKQYHVDHLTLAVDDEVYDEYGDPMPLNAVFEVVRKTSTITMREDDQVISVTLPPVEMNKLLKWMVHHLKIFCWQEDYTPAQHDDFDDDWDEWLDDEDADEAEDDESEKANEAEEAPFCWKLDITYRNSTSQQVSSPYAAPDRVLELIQELLTYLYPDELDDEEPVLTEE